MSFFQRTHPVRRAVAELGPVGSGATGAFYVQTIDGTEYVAKAKSRYVDGPYVPANELICADLGAGLGFPVLPTELIVVAGGETAFGSLRMANDEFTPMSSATAAKLLEPEYFSMVAVLDLFVCNTDRHPGNLLARKLRNPRGLRLLAVDHSHALSGPGITPADVPAFFAQVDSLAPERYFASHDLREGVYDCQTLRDALGSVEVLHDEIAGVVASVPSEWLSDQEKEILIKFLQERAPKIRALLQGAQHLFPKLKGAAL